MWYVIQVTSGEERKTIEMMKALILPDLLSEVFLPEVQVMKRYKGRWHKERRVMFPSYVFVVTNQVEELFLACKTIPKLTKILGTGSVPVALEASEVKLLKGVLNQEHLVEISTGILVGTTLKIESGPMKGLEGLVKRIDRHKRIAVLDVEMFGRKVEMTMGVEVVEKW